MADIEQATAAPGEDRNTRRPTTRTVVLSGDPAYDGRWVVITDGGSYITLHRA